MSFLMLKKTSIAILFCMLSLFASGCHTVPTPDGFVQLQDGNGFKFVSSDDSRVWVREFSVSSDAKLDFWKEALHLELIDTRGYSLIKENSLDDFTHEMTFKKLNNGKVLTYYLRITMLKGFSGTKLRTAEFMAEEKSFDRHFESVLKALKG